MEREYHCSDGSFSSVYCQTKEQTWQQWFDVGRSLVKANSWEGACLSYRRALDAAEQILCQRCQAERCQGGDLKRYLNTAEEYAFVLRKNDFAIATEAFIAYVQNRLVDQLAPSDLKPVIKLLSKLCNASEEELEKFYRKRFSNPHLLNH